MQRFVWLSVTHKLGAGGGFIGRSKNASLSGLNRGKLSALLLNNDGRSCGGASREELALTMAGAEAWWIM